MRKSHLHEASNIEIAVQEVARAIKRRAEEHSNAPPSAIYQQEVSQISNDEVIANMPQRNDVIRNHNRYQNRRRPTNPRTLQDLLIEAPYTRTLNGEMFIQFDSGADDENRFIVFYTVKNLERVVSSRMILCDGTFKTVPGIFYQLYTIHANVLNYTFPLVYCLATRKTEDFYRRLLNHLVLHAEQINRVFCPQYILSDFEISFTKAARSIFPNSQIKGCLFHFTQAVWRQTVLRGLKQQYSNNDSTIRDIIQKLLALPFVPEQDILDVFDTIVAEVPEDLEDDQPLMDVINYVERTYVRGRPARGRRPAVNARFPPKIWTVYELTVNRQQRSTNAVEGFHSKFLGMIQSYHSGIWKFVEHLQRDQNENEICIIQLEAGHTRVRYPIKPKYKKNQDQIEIIVGNYETFKEENNIMNYLKNISYKIFN